MKRDHHTGNGSGLRPPRDHPRPDGQDAEDTAAASSWKIVALDCPRGSLDPLSCHQECGGKHHASAFDLNRLPGCAPTASVA